MGIIEKVNWSVLVKNKSCVKIYRVICFFLNKSVYL